MKAVGHHLAFFGGEPTFKHPLHVGRPNIGDRESFRQRINDILDRRWLTNNGPIVQELEHRIAEFLGVKHCIAMCNGTIALEIAARTLDLSGEVIIPSFTFVATAHALQWQGITPVFCDVAPGKHHMDPRRVESLITPRTTGIMGVHVWGEVYGIEQLQEIADKHGLRLMFDAAHAFAVSHNGAMVGSFGEAEVLSFHATKFFNSLEGGAITTNNDDIAEKARFMRDFGFAGYDQVDYIGTNGKMNEISAAMGLTSLESLPEFVDVNKRNYQTYQHELTGLPGIRLFEYDKTERRNYQYIVVEVDQNQTGISRDSLVEILHAENVLARRYFYPGCHKMEPYRSLFPHAGLLLPETERLTTRVMSLPNGTSVNTSDVEQICALIHFLVENGEAITARLLQ